MKISTTIKKEVIEAYEAAGFTQTNDGVYDNYVSDAEGNEISYDEAVVDAGEF